MKTIIAGSRNITDIKTLLSAIKACGWEITSVVCGKARGVDTLGEEWAKLNELPVYEFPADWNAHGKRAGYLRNVEMAKNATALLAIWDGKSKGTGHMIDIANARGLNVFVFNTNEEPHLF